MKPFDEINDPDDRDIADWRGILINRLRSMDLDKVAHEADLSVQTVRDFYSGKTTCPSIRTFKRLTRVTDARIAILKGGGSPRQTHELRLTARERRFLDEMMAKHEE